MRWCMAGDSAAAESVPGFRRSILCHTRRTARQALVVVTLCAAVLASAQECPRPSSNGPSTPSKARGLEGVLVFHNGIRQWFELKLDQPQCGKKSVQLVRVEGDWTPLETLRSCRVRSKGTIDYSPTGYYSLDMYQDVEQIEPVGDCVRRPPFPSFSSARPDPAIRQYRVEMSLDYRPGDHPIVFQIESGGKELEPWQAYASYDLTGGFVLYGSCGKGFVVDKVFGTPQADPSHFDEPDSPDDMAAFDPESAAASGQKELHLGYTCIRTP